MTIEKDISSSVTTKAFKAKLAYAVRQLGGVTEAARKWGVDYQRISNAINSDVLPSKGILKAMGYESVKTINYRYRKVGK